MVTVVAVVCQMFQHDTRQRRHTPDTLHSTGPHTSWHLQHTSRTHTNPGNWFSLNGAPLVTADTASLPAAAPRTISNTHSVLVSTYLQIEAQSNICMRITVVCRTADLHRVHQIFVNEYRELKWFLVMVEVDNVDNLIR